MDETQANAESVKLRCLSMEQSLENSEERIRQLTAERDSAIVDRKQVDETVSALHTRLTNQELTIRQLRSKSDESAVSLQDEKTTRLEMEASFKDNQDVLVLSPDSDFFRYMKSPDTLRK